MRGSYRTALPDGRTQVVTYEVHPTDGYKAKVTYEGTAQYPDTPGYVASPYGPPEPIRPQGYERKFKRQSKQPKDKTKQSDNIFNELEPVDTVRSERKTVSNPEKAENQNDLFSLPSQTVFAVKHKKVATKPIAIKATPIAIEKFDDTPTSPHAEPLSLQQVFAPKKVHTKKPKTFLRQNLEQNKSNTLNAQILEQSTDQTIVLPAPLIVTQKSETTPIYDDTFYDSPYIPQAEPLSLQQNSKQIRKQKTKKNPNIQVKPKGLGDIQSIKTFYTPEYLSKYEILETRTEHITADSTQASTVISNKNSDDGKDATAADIPAITDADSEISVTAQTDSADVNTEAVKIVDTSTHIDEIIEQISSADKQDNSAPLKGDTSNTIKSVPLLDNTFYETQFLGSQYRPFRAIINTGPSTQHIVNPYEYKIGQNSHKFQSLQSQYLSQEETDKANNLVEEEQTEGAKSLTEEAEDIFVENDIDADYFEDYNTFLFGLRLPSVILPSNNQIEVGNTKTEFRVTNDKEIEASTIKPHDIIHKVRVPKDYSIFRQARTLSNNNNHQPVERGARVKFVQMKAGSFVPQYYTV